MCDFDSIRGKLAGKESKSLPRRLPNANDSRVAGIFHWDIKNWRRLRINERHLDQLHVDCETQPPVELIEHSGFPA